ncbi:radical SAM protein [Patescibacteria group bacterium]|nr:radical SAM protein [Patescibacteria group bacterium]MBU1730677.1 radical SAM protein [Patescibacteria group bacterium]MBU1967517.1 radical SAM protein [Patescibacteria group bacterium]
MKRLSLESQISIKGGTGYFLRTADNLRILSADTLLCETSGATRKIGISVSSGCRVGCRYCFTNKYSCYRQLSQRELCEQVSFVLERNPTFESSSALKVSLKQMGDPALNSRQVLAALRLFAGDYPDAMLVVSTSAPKIEAGFFEGLQKLQDSGANIRLQFSCHTTSDAERGFLSHKIPMMSLAEIGVVANRWNGQRVTLNFVVFEGYSYDVEVLEKHFNPDKVLIKINYIDRNTQTEKNEFRDVVASQKHAFVESLQRAGYKLAHRKLFA